MSAGVLGRSLELYFIDGRPDGMLTAEVFNWTGHVLVTPRTRLKEALARTQSSFTGVYLLLGERDGKPLAYIGEGEDIAARMKSHEANKDWWTTAVLVTSAANNLHKAHAKFLESRLVEEARKVGVMPLDNGNTPPRPGLSESARANMEAFLDYLFMVLPAVRIDMFVQKVRPSTAAGVAVSGPPAAKPTVEFRLDYPSQGLTAVAVLEDGEFVVQAGSHARAAWEGKEKAASGYASLHDDLRRSGVLILTGDHCTFAENYAFSSPSAAAAIVYGRQAQGTTAWKTPAGQTYKDWEATQLAG
ncbi:GIY-YIG nuclease family protein [Brevundimonas sp.]|uniref:GIY-YIG nuclease family protein n=1 Tax=Brevundimonas sp. TaxID=1871086 RepID=UPI0025BCCA3B|nr:GIY-YIG nuclease family protein [Brevundimonas sp.]